MSIAVHVHDTDPQALAELIEKTVHEGVVIDREPEVGTLAALVESEEREGDRRRAAWHWLNSIAGTTLDQDNDWSDV
ncbi:MAG: hypothetical protein JO257_00530 [Deltaproteobacteria bacterium]|nr:hypothetical protein [Deltaproteobacteria bacterium]